jgi:hypothetical protein
LAWIGLDRQPSEGSATAAYSTSAANAARSDICFSFIEVDPEHAVAAFGQSGRSCEAFRRTLLAPAKALLGACLLRRELPRPI